MVFLTSTLAPLKYSYLAPLIAIEKEVVLIHSIIHKLCGEPKCTQHLLQKSPNALNQKSSENLY